MTKRDSDVRVIASFFCRKPVDPRSSDFVDARGHSIPFHAQSGMPGLSTPTMRYQTFPRCTKMMTHA